MGVRNRRWYLLVGAGCALVVIAVVAGLVLAFSGTSQAAPTPAEYFARVAAICRVYGPKLDNVPPADIAEPGNVIESVSRALPLIKAETGAVRALKQPKSLHTQLAQWFELHDRSIARLEAALRAARKQDLRALIVAYGQFILQGPKTERLGAAIGIPHPPC
jgi:hypothetical protein